MHDYHLPSKPAPDQAELLLKPLHYMPLVRNSCSCWFLLTSTVVMSFVYLLCETRGGTQDLAQTQQALYRFSPRQTQLCAEQSKCCGFLLVAQFRTPEHNTSSSFSRLLGRVVQVMVLTEWAVLSCSCSFGYGNEE